MPGAKHGGTGPNRKRQAAGEALPEQMMRHGECLSAGTPGFLLAKTPLFTNIEPETETGSGDWRLRKSA